MQMQRLWALLLALPLALTAVGCGGDEAEEVAAGQDAVDRDIELALSEDRGSPTLEDRAPEPPPSPTPPEASSRSQSSQSQSTQRSQPSSRSSEPERVRAEPPAPRVVTLVVPTGTTFAVHLDEGLATDENEVGDPFSATLSDPIVDMNGQVLLPAGATVRGRVTGLEKSDRVGDSAVIRLAFESVSFEGRSYPLQATVVEANPERRTRTSTAQSAGKVAAGAAAGAIVGQVLGKNTRSTVTGAVVGAAAGTAIALGTADVDAVLPAGSRMVIRLDAPVEVRRTVR